ncbi:MAG: transposase [Chloroflexota bacterium]|nr:transposase [Chloroflexota bacterium]
MNAYSQDLRERIVRAVQGGMSRAEAARRFMVNERTVRRYLRRYERTGSIAPTVFRPGPPPTIGPDHEAALLAQLTDAPDATLGEHCARWEREQGRTLSVSTMCRAQQRIGWTVKKSRSSPASKTP